MEFFIHSHASVFHIHYFHATTMNCLTNAVSVQEPPDCVGVSVNP